MIISPTTILDILWSITALAVKRNPLLYHKQSLLVWEMFASLEHVLIALIEVERCDMLCDGAFGDLLLGLALRCFGVLPGGRIEQGKRVVRSFHMVMVLMEEVQASSRRDTRRKIEIIAARLFSCSLGFGIRFAPTGRYHIVPYGKLNGIPVALVARFGVIFKGMLRIGFQRLL
ncbi:hypothetical protein Tco_0073285 [Tanacetum coccineum]